MFKYQTMVIIDLNHLIVNICNFFKTYFIANYYQVRDIFKLRGRYPHILKDGHILLTITDQTFLHVVGFVAGPYMGHIHWDYPLLEALPERWDSLIGTFHLLTREMTIMVEDIHHLYHLPIQGQWIQHVIDRDLVRLTITTFYGVGVINKFMSKIFFGGLPYLRYLRNDQQGLLKASYLMGMIQCYALLDTSNGRFPWSLLPLVASMLQQGMVYTWAPTLLAQIYQELFFYSLDHRASLLFSITLQVWSYEHIHVAHPLGLSVPSFSSYAMYPTDIMHWREDFYMQSSDGIR